MDPAGASDGDIQRVHDELVHDKETPQEGFSPIPIFLVLLLSTLIVFCGIYMVWRSDDFDQLGYDETRRRFPWEATEGGAAAAPAAQIGQRFYTQNCAMCHQPAGQGAPGVFPPLDGSPWAVGEEERVIRIVLHGMVGEIERDGATYNGAMPAFGQLSNDQLASILTYIRQAWSNEAEPVSAAQVGAVRNEVGSRGPWQADELRQQFGD